MNLSQIKSDALAATQGEWYSNSGDSVVWVNGPDSTPLLQTCTKTYYQRHDEVDKANARHIANMDPPTTIALVEEVERLREALKPFSDIAGAFFAKNYSIHEKIVSEDHHDLGQLTLTVKDFHNARRAMTYARQALGEDNER